MFHDTCLFGYLGQTAAQIKLVVPQLCHNRKLFFNYYYKCLVIWQINNLLIDENGHFVIFIFPSQYALILHV